MTEVAESRRADRPEGPVYSERRRVAWADTDAGGRIHFTAALRYAEDAETGLRRELGLLGDWGNWQILRGEEPCVEGRFVVVHVDRAGKPAPLPEDVRSALGDHRHEGGGE